MYNIECPYCGEEFEDSNYGDKISGGDNTYDTECPHCQEEMEITVELNPSFSAYIIFYHDCVECGKTYRHTGNWYPRPNKYENDKLPICDKCRCELIVKQN